jgi:hypothetical protein
MPAFTGIDTSRIHAIIARARRRLRMQAALESATTASILALGAALVVVYLVRRHTLDENTGFLLLVACAGLVVIGAVLGAMIRLPQHIVATRIDRASGLSDRLSTACAFEAQLASKDLGLRRPEDEQTEALMLAAIRDAVAATPRANVVAATPFRWPRDGRAALVFGVLGLAVAGLYWPNSDVPVVADPAAAAAAAQAEREALAEKQRLEDDDLDYTRDLLEDMRRVAKAERDPSLEQFVSEVEALLAKAELGELSKEELLEKLAKAEQQYMQGRAEDIEQALADLKDTGKELQKNEVTRELGKALEQGDMEAAQQQMEALAQKLEKGELTEQQKSEVAKALEQAAKQFEQKDQQREQELDKQIEQAKAEMERLEQQQEKAKNEQEKQKLTRKLESQKKQLEKLEQEKMKREESAQRRNLKSLHRNLEQASKQMRQDGGDQQQQQQQQRMASQNLRKAADDAGQVDADQRKMAAQKKVASQLEDLKEAMRRAKQRGQNGPKDLFGKNQRNQDFLRRAQGQQGSRQAWQRGQQSGRISQGQHQQGQGQGQQGQQPGQQGQGQQGQGQQPGGQSYGDEHDPNVLGDSTPRAGKTKDESVSGVHGRGPSRRETILSAAQKGFANRAYEQIYAEYKNIVEEVVRAEKVPSGYKYYVKRYFQKIKPHSME